MLIKIYARAGLYVIRSLLLNLFFFNATVSVIVGINYCIVVTAICIGFFYFLSMIPVCTATNNQRASTLPNGQSILKF